MYIHLQYRDKFKKYPKEWVDELIFKTDIVKVINKFLPLRKKRHNKTEFVAMSGCPFHNEKTSSFTVTQEKQFYHCFGCGIHGGAISFLMEYNGWSFDESVRYLARMYKVKLPYKKIGKK